MTTPNYRLVFSGKLLKGFKHPEVQHALAQLLKIPLDQAGHLIQGDRFRINKALEKSKAERLLEKIRARGAECSIEPVGPSTRSASRIPEKVGVVASSPSTEQSSSPDEPLSLDLPELTPEDDRTRPMEIVQPEVVDEDIVLEAAAAERAAYQPDDDSENVGTFYERSTVAETRDDAAREKRKRLILLAAGLIAVVVVVVGLLLPMLLEEPPAPVVATTPAIPVNPQRAATNRRLEQLNRSIRVWMIQYGSGFNPAQVTLERLQQDLSIGEQEMLDGWGTALRFEPEAEKYRVISAGPDKSFGTPDDLKRETAIK